MGRKLMRVPFDFKWELGEVWKGYLNPYYKKCPDCENGYTKDRINFQEFVNDLMWHSKLVEITTGLAGRVPRTPFGHDRYAAEKKIISAAGLDPEVWGICQTCKGHAIDPTTKEQYETWKSEEPPIGDGYQLWETTSEGSPSSPVFNTLDELCEWCEENATTFGSFKAKKSEWLKMLSEDNVYHSEGGFVFIQHHNGV